MTSLITFSTVGSDAIIMFLCSETSRLFAIAFAVVVPIQKQILPPKVLFFKKPATPDGLKNKIPSNSSVKWCVFTSVVYTIVSIFSILFS